MIEYLQKLDEMSAVIPLVVIALACLGVIRW